MAPSDTVQLRGSLIEWREFGSKSWGRGSMRVDDSIEALTIVGVIAGAREGCALEVSGRHELHPRFGAQFIVLRAQVAAPRTEEGVIAWIAATFPNVGRGRAAALLEHFRGDVELLWQTVVDAPERLTEVRGITADRARDIRDAYLLARDDRDSQISLRGWGLTDGQIGRCIKHWHSASAAVRAIQANPYALFHHVDGFGWSRADAVARASGVPPDAPTRIGAAIEHTMLERVSAGHIYMQPGYLSRAVRELLGPDCSPDAMRAGIITALREGVIVKRGARVYLRVIDRVEWNLATLVTVRLAS